MSEEARIFCSATGRTDDAGKVSVTMQVWSTWDATMATAVLEAMRSLLGEPEEEVLFDDTAGRKLYAAAADSGAIVLKSRDEERG